MAAKEAEEKAQAARTREVEQQRVRAAKELEQKEKEAKAARYGTYWARDIE